MFFLVVLVFILPGHLVAASHANPSRQVPLRYPRLSLPDPKVPDLLVMVYVSNNVRRLFAGVSLCSVYVQVHPDY